MGNSFQSKRNLNLDLYRAIAILLVLYYHVTQMVYGQSIMNKSLYACGKYGVTLFFVLSGFLVGHMYYQNTKISAIVFWLKRFLRTYPPYLVILLVSWISVYYFRNQGFDWLYLVMGQNFYVVIPYFLVSWSLCVEEHFYLIFALVILLLKNKKHHQLVWACLCILPTFFKYLLGSIHHNDFGYYTTATYFQIDSIAFGVLLSYVLNSTKIDYQSNKVICIGLFIAFLITSYMLVSYKNSFTFYFGSILINIIATLMLISLFFTKSLRLSHNKFVKINAKMAYSLYLVHPIVIHLVILSCKRLNIQNNFLTYLIIIVCIYLVGYLFYILVERPAINIRNIYFMEKQKRINA